MYLHTGLGLSSLHFSNYSEFFLQLIASCIGTAFFISSRLCSRDFSTGLLLQSSHCFLFWCLCWKPMGSANLKDAQVLWVQVIERTKQMQQTHRKPKLTRQNFPSITTKEREKITGHAVYRQDREPHPQHWAALGLVERDILSSTQQSPAPTEWYPTRYDECCFPCDRKSISDHEIYFKFKWKALNFNYAPEKWFLNIVTVLKQAKDIEMSDPVYRILLCLSQLSAREPLWGCVYKGVFRCLERLGLFPKKCI